MASAILSHRQLPVALFLALLLGTLRAKSLLHLALRQPGLKISQRRTG